MSAAEKGEIEYSGLETAIIQSLREGERATLSVLMISGSGRFSNVPGDTQIDVYLKDGSLQWLTMPMSRLERMRRDSGGLAAVVMRAVRVWLVASPLISLVPHPTGPSTHSCHVPLAPRLTRICRAAVSTIQSRAVGSHQESVRIYVDARRFG
jgi:hypothetical protein